MLQQTGRKITAVMPHVHLAGVTPFPTRRLVQVCSKEDVDGLKAQLQKIWKTNNIPDETVVEMLQV